VGASKNYQPLASAWGTSYFGNAPALGLYPTVIVDRSYGKVPKVFPWVVRPGHYKLGVLMISDRCTHSLFFFSRRNNLIDPPPIFLGTPQHKRLNMLPSPPPHFFTS